MPSKIAIIAILGLTTSAVCIGAGAAIGARDFGGLDFPLFGGPHCEAVAGATATSGIVTGTSLKLCTARSTRFSSSATSNSCVNSPFPPISGRGLSRSTAMRKPCPSGVTTRR